MEKLFVLCILLVSASCQVVPDKTWLFAVDGRKRPYSFLDPFGTLVGFDVDLIGKVCAIAGKKCAMVLAEFPECIYTHRDITYPGRGLMGGWFDACPGYEITIDRRSGFEFTEPYLETVSSFTVAPGNPNNFDPALSDYSQFVITHLTGAPTNAMCLNRLKKKFNKIIVARDLPDAKNLLINNTAQVLFSPRTVIPDLDVLQPYVNCDDGGAGIMVKKGSELLAWWNPAFKAFSLSGSFKQLCADATLKYNATVRCMQNFPPRLNHWENELRKNSKPLKFFL